MRDAPPWFQSALTHLGGVNPYGEPIFRLSWSTDERTVIGGRWAQDGFEGYKQAPAVPGEGCWALMVWEPRETQGTADQWEWSYLDAETGLLDCGGYPKFGRYRLLKKFMYRELVEQEKLEQRWVGYELRQERVSAAKMETYRMEPNGMMLDLILPMLILWRKMSNERRVEVSQEREDAKNKEFHRISEDIRNGAKVRRGSPLVAKRAELIEKGFEQAMRMAAQTGLGMRMGD